MTSPGEILTSIVSYRFRRNRASDRSTTRHRAVARGHRHRRSPAAGAADRRSPPAPLVSFSASRLVASSLVRRCRSDPLSRRSRCRLVGVTADAASRRYALPAPLPSAACAARSYALNVPRPTAMLDRSRCPARSPPSALNRELAATAVRSPLAAVPPLVAPGAAGLLFPLFLSALPSFLISFWPGSSATSWAPPRPAGLLRDELGSSETSKQRTHYLYVEIPIQMEHVNVLVPVHDRSLFLSVHSTGSLTLSLATASPSTLDGEILTSIVSSRFRRNRASERSTTRHRAVARGHRLHRRRGAARRSPVGGAAGEFLRVASRRVASSLPIRPAVAPESLPSCRRHCRRCLAPPRPAGAAAERRLRRSFVRSERTATAALCAIAVPGAIAATSSALIRELAATAVRSPLAAVPPLYEVVVLWHSGLQERSIGIWTPMVRVSVFIEIHIA
ncbi:hypothetical protein Scep_027544 [Stephania cephalantha]|uniref:Uncharacterized protein n=1 Tax=Stephania cephalantha TaxID=152367 RepID=A0AAP0EBL1_9MAGN